MNKHLINFEDMLWIDAGKGVLYKVYKSESQQIRLVEFREGFVEEEWCNHGHTGYVLEGNFSIDYNGETEMYKRGDIIFIPQGEADKHKAILGKGERVLLLLFENKFE